MEPNAHQELRIEEVGDLYEAPEWLGRSQTTLAGSEHRVLLTQIDELDWAFSIQLLSIARNVQFEDAVDDALCSALQHIASGGEVTRIYRGRWRFEADRTAEPDDILQAVFGAIFQGPIVKQLEQHLKRTPLNGPLNIVDTTSKHDTNFQEWTCYTTYTNPSLAPGDTEEIHLSLLSPDADEWLLIVPMFEMVRDPVIEQDLRGLVLAELQSLAGIWDINLEAGDRWLMRVNDPDPMEIITHVYRAIFTGEALHRLEKHFEDW